MKRRAIHYHCPETNGYIKENRKRKLKILASAGNGICEWRTLMEHAEAFYD